MPMRGRVRVVILAVLLSIERLLANAIIAQMPSLTKLRRHSYSAVSLHDERTIPENPQHDCLLVRRDGQVALAGDGQVTLGETVMKASAKKVRRLYNDKILAGFAGATGDAFSLLTRFEGKLEQYHGNLERAAIELSKEWRTDKILRHLEALLVVADDKTSFLLSGNGDVIAPDDGVLAIGSGGSYALAAARALMANTQLSAREIAVEALRIAGEICIYSKSEHRRGRVKRGSSVGAPTVTEV